MHLLGDVICQCIQNNSNKADGITTAKPATAMEGTLQRHTSTGIFNLERALRFSAVGFTLHGPYFFAGFRMLDILGGPSTSVANVLRKVALGQITINPAYLCTLYYYLGWMEGRPHDERVSRVKEGFLPTIE